MSDDQSNIYWVRPKCEDSRPFDTGYCGQDLPASNRHINSEQRVSQGYFKAIALSVHEAEIATLRAERDKLRAALSASRGQWIHSVNKEQCLKALGE